MADTPGITARKLALQALRDVLDRGITLDRALDRALVKKSTAGPEIPARDRAFVHQLVATTLRRLGHIDLALKKYLKRPLPQSAAGARHILRLAAAQILFLDTPPHAAVDTSVALASKDRHPNVRRLKGLINAVSRKIAVDKDSLIARSADDPLGNLPTWLKKSWLAHFGETQAKAVAGALLQAPPLDLTFRDITDTETFANALANSAEATPAPTRLPNGSLRLAPGTRVKGLPGYNEGRWWVQDAAAALAVPLFGDVSGKTIADLCAAPGGKTLQLAAKGARVIAVDSSVTRLRRLRENLARTKLSADVVTSDAREWLPPSGVELDGVLLDAPCSATGTLRRHPDVPYHRSPGGMAELAAGQAALLDHAFDLLRPGGTAIYSVCSLERSEGQDQIEAFLARTPSAVRKVVVADELPELADARSDKGDIQTLPCHWADKGGMDGFYIARIQKRLD